MRLQILIVLLTFLIVSTVKAQVANHPFQHLNENEIIQVTGEAEFEITPDQIFLTINIRESDVKNKTVEQLEQEMIQKLGELGVNVKENLVVHDISSNFKHVFIGGSKIKTSKSYQLELNKPQQVTQVVLALEELGISDINLDRLDHTRMDDFKKEVRVKAMIDAKTKASYLLEAVDQALGKLVYAQELAHVSTTESRARELSIRGVVSRGYEEYSPSKEVTQIDFEKIKIEYRILAKFKID